MTRIFEINKLLFITSEFFDQQGVIGDVLLREVRRTKLGIESSDYRDVLEMCLDLNLVARNGEYVALTDSGRRYLTLMTQDGIMMILDPNTSQKKFLLDTFESSTRFAKELKLFFGGFGIDFSGRDKFWFATQERAVLPDDLVVEVELVRERGDRLEVDTSKSAIVSKIRKGKITEEELLDILDRQKDTGRASEDLTLEYEKNRLTKDGFPDLALGVQKISAVDPCAGYDVRSFDGNNQSYVHDRRIEVKGTSLNNNRFYWSRNEIDVAKELGDEYWIYFWKNVADSGTPTLETIRNPYERFFVQKAGNLWPVSYEVKW